MSTHTRIFLMLSVLVCIGLLTGCAPKAQLALNFAPAQTDTYKTTTEMIKDVKFDQPSLNKSSFDQTSTEISVTEQRKVLEIDEKGVALAQATIQAVKVMSVIKNETQYDFDSSRKKDASDPLAKLIGLSYSLRLHPDGTADVVDAAAARAVKIDGGMAGALAKRILSDNGIVERHHILAMPDAEKARVSVGKRWSRLESSSPGLFPSKSFEKVYTLTGIKNAEGRKIAAVRMSAGESTKPAPGATSVSPLGPLAKMFDTEDQYSGSMTFDLAGGQVQNFEEKLVTTYLVEDPQQATDNTQKPDTLRIRFTQSIETTRLK